jgi:hypothetical protein
MKAYNRYDVSLLWIPESKLSKGQIPVTGTTFRMWTVPATVRQVALLPHVVNGSDHDKKVWK